MCPASTPKVWGWGLVPGAWGSDKFQTSVKARRLYVNVYQNHGSNGDDSSILVVVMMLALT